MDDQQLLVEVNAIARSATRRALRTALDEHMAALIAYEAALGSFQLGSTALADARQRAEQTRTAMRACWELRFGCPLR